VTSPEALALAYALETGALGLEEAREWAAVQIGKTDTPANALLDLAVERNLADAISQLRVLGQDAVPAEAGRLMYRHLHEAIAKGVLSHEKAAHAIVRLAQDSCSPSADAASQSLHLDDAFYLARHEAYGTVAEVKVDVEDHLKRFAV
jgi:hypothetical protein